MELSEDERLSKGHLMRLTVRLGQISNILEQDGIDKYLGVKELIQEQKLLTILRDQIAFNIREKELMQEESEEEE